MFNEFFLKFQSKGMMIHVLHEELKSVLLQLLRRIVKADVVNNLSAKRLKKLKLDDDLLLPPENCYHGPKTEQALKAVSPHDARLEKKKMQKHCLVITKYFQKNYPLDSDIFRDLSALPPKVYMLDATVTSIEHIAQLLPHVLLVQKIPK